LKQIVGVRRVWNEDRKGDDAVELVKLSEGIVARYKEMNPFEKLLDHDPVFGLKRVDHQNEVQDYQNKILSQKAKP
jgi:hypothetical protein